MKTAIVHDDLVQWGGAERVLSAISEAFPFAPIYTSVFDKSNKILNKKFNNKKIITSFLQKIPGWKYMYKALLPFYPIAFEQFDFSGYDLVISHTTRFAKSIITKPQTKHICYCHTPPRFLWGFSGERPPAYLTPLLSLLRIYDEVSNTRVDEFLAGSKNACERIKKIYRKDSKILFPFVEVEKFEGGIFDGGYYLIVSRLNDYKRVDLAVRLFSKHEWNLKIVGIGPQLGKLKMLANENIQFLGSVPESVLVKLLLGCRAVIITAEEDFGLTALEAQASGKGVVAFKKGGCLETVIEGKTGVFFDGQNEKSLRDAIERFEILDIDPKFCRENAKRFTKEKFIKNLLQLV